MLLAVRKQVETMEQSERNCRERAMEDKKARAEIQTLRD